MRALTIVLMVFVAGVGANSGYRLVTGENLVNLGNPFQGSTEAPGPAATATPQEPPRVATAAPEPTTIPTVTSAPPEPAPQPDQPFEPFWVQNHRETDLWSGSDSNAISFGQAAQWSYFRVVAPQEGSRLYVFNPLTEDYAYVDASAVGPSSAPSRDYRLATAGTTPVVGNTDGLGVYVRRSPAMGDRQRAWPEGTRMEGYRPTQPWSRYHLQNGLVG